MANRKTRIITIKTALLSIDDIINLYRKLSILVNKAGKIHVDTLEKLINESEDDFQKYKSHIVESYKLRIEIGDANSEELLIGLDENIFQSTDFPDEISVIHFTSRAPFANINRGNEAQNWLALNLDFSKPPLLDWRNALSNPTPNFSNLNVSGLDNSWVGAVCNEVTDLLGRRSNKRQFMHRPFTYDVGLLLFGFPISLFAAAKGGTMIESITKGLHQIFEVGGYIYVFFITLFLYRLLFGYTKWVFPLVELTNSQNVTKKHRQFWKWLILVIATIIVGWIIWPLKDFLVATFFSSK